LVSVEIPPKEERVYRPEEPLDAEKLWELAESVREQGSGYLIRDLLGRATAEKDARFAELLEWEDLRERTGARLILKAYDYAINGNEEALDEILAEHEAQPKGGDVNTVVVLAYLDEWERTVPAIVDFYSEGADGAAGSCRRHFYSTRETYFPETYWQLIEDARRAKESSSGL
jgi:hypothetical protein